MTTTILDQLINQYTGSVANLQTGSIALGKELFNAVVLISVAILGLNHLLRKNVDLADANFELIRWLIYLNFFYAFIVNFPGIYSFIFSSIQQIGDYLGAQAAGKTVDISPSSLFQIGLNLSWTMLSRNVTLNVFRDFFIIIISVIAAAVVLFSFACIGLELILVQIGSQIILAGGIFLLAFSGLQWTRDYAERYVHTFFHIGVKMTFIYILVGLGIGLTQTWAQTISTVQVTNFIDQYMLVALSSYVYCKLCMKLPDQAVSWLTGRLAMGFDTTTDIRAAIRAPAAAATKIKQISEGVTKMGQEFSGYARAAQASTRAAKVTLASQGKKDTVFNTGWESIKTFGEARAQLRDKKVDDTEGGKIAKSISDKMTADTNAKSGSNEDYSI